MLFILWLVVLFNQPVLALVWAMLWFGWRCAMAAEASERDQRAKWENEGWW